MGGYAALHGPCDRWDAKRSRNEAVSKRQLQLLLHQPAGRCGRNADRVLDHSRDRRLRRYQQLHQWQCRVPVYYIGVARNQPEPILIRGDDPQANSIASCDMLVVEGAMSKDVGVCSLKRN